MQFKSVAPRAEVVVKIVGRQPKGSIIQGFDNPILTVMSLGFFHINPYLGIIKPSDY